MVGRVWLGSVWYGMVWYGMVWYGMVWYGMVWYGMVRGLACGTRSTSSASVYMHLYLAATTSFEPLMAVCENKVQVQRSLNIPNKTYALELN